MSDAPPQRLVLVTGPSGAGRTTAIHVLEDFGFIPSFADWVRAIRPQPWMGRAQPIHKLVDPFAEGPDTKPAAARSPHPGPGPSAA